MTASQLSPTASTRASSIRARNRPTISFFGRPGDSRKGLVTFVDTLSILLELRHVPSFSVWIIGGSDAELDFIESLLNIRPSLAALREQGALTLWGRVNIEALPELYSRSSVTVMPSLREQFGIVAVEAMMCGCPVAAANVGGLPDIVLSSYTGTIVDVDDAAALANALLGYLRSADRVMREGANAVHWARIAFDRDMTYKHFAKIYRGNTLPPSPHFPNRAILRELELEELRGAVSEFFGRRVEVHDLSSSDHTSAMVSLGKERYFCKWYRPERSDHIAVLPVASELRRERTIDYYAGHLIFHADNALVARVIRRPDEAQPFAIFEWCEPASPVDLPDELRRIAVAFRSFRPASSDDPIADRYLETLRAALQSRTLEAIDEHDVSAAVLNARVSHGLVRFQQVHPHIELIRMRLLLHDNAWALSYDVRERFIGAIDFVLSRSAIPIELPKLCHGSLKPEHLLRRSSGEIVVCDIDSSRYVVGRFDEVHHVWNAAVASPAFGATAALSRLAKMIESADELSIAASWLMVYLIFDALLTATTGGDLRRSRSFQICRDLPYAWRHLIQSR